MCAFVTVLAFWYQVLPPSRPNLCATSPHQHFDLGLLVLESVQEQRRVEQKLSLYNNICVCLIAIT